MVKTFLDSKHYTDFASSRDRLLEKILHHHLNVCDLVMSKLRRKVAALVSQRSVRDAFRIHGQGPIKNELHLASLQTETMTHRLRKKTYLLSVASEAEALGRAMGKPMTYSVHTKRRDHKEMPSGGSVEDRILLYFNRLAREIQDALQLSKTLDEDLASTMARVDKAFPRTRKISKTPALSNRKMKERDTVQPQITSMSTGFVDDNTWDEILDDYRSDTLPPSIIKRSGEDKTLFYDVERDDLVERYTWEVEQEITEDFVTQVREGKLDAANQNGYTDSMWVAVIDSHTDECCSVRDGLTSSQIDDFLDSGKINKDECDAVVAPAHFKCRCDNAPVTDDLPEYVPYDYGDLDQWLEDKAA